MLSTVLCKTNITDGERSSHRYATHYGKVMQVGGECWQYDTAQRAGDELTNNLQ